MDPQPQPVVKIEIVLDRASGGVTVNGHINDPIFALGLIEVGKLELARFWEQAAKQKLVAVHQPLPVNGHKEN